ncbi:MAG TPA: transglycosylase SLT domain-containing protein [Acidimicrobiales bacterium]|nr:transglycosylase SLT domain-containing protein [Acidimicrobiales bacterium]
MTSGMAEVQARIAAIQQSFAPPPVAPAAGAVRGGGDSAELAFEAALARASVGGGPAAGAPAWGAAASGASGASGAGAAGAAGAAPGVGARSGSLATAERGSWGDAGAGVIDAARRYLGVPYRWGGTDPATGLDCSGFVQRTFADVGVDLPRVSRDQARAGTPVPSLAEAMPGDLLAFDNTEARAGVDHIGIYLGQGRMIVAPRTGDVVKIQEVKGTPVAIRRVLPGGPAAAGAGDGAGVAVPATPYAELFRAAGERHGVAPRLLAAVARAESNFDATAVSRAGARGLMQLMPATAASLGVDPLDPEQAVDGAARLLAGHLRRFGTTELALAAYNAGGGAVARHGGVPPDPETQAYVRRITAELEGSTP